MRQFEMEADSMPEQLRVLVVDDEEVVLQSVRKVLKSDEEHEFLVDTALSPGEGLELLEPGKYDVVVTDLMMPGIDGLQLIDRIRQIDRDTRIVMITGYATMRTALQALRKGAFDYVAKPFTKDELRTVVKNAAQLKKMSNQPQATAEAPPAGGEFRSFFKQTYARLLPDGTMHFGIEPIFLSTIGTPLSMDIAKVGETIPQGLPFATVTSSNMRVFNLRAPFSARILKINQEAVKNFDVVREDPRGKGWLLHVIPMDFESELENIGQ
jgi:CheY-like chemotaxis protein/glycine cleavage system H lipoate-binding protein